MYPWTENILKNLEWCLEIENIDGIICRWWMTTDTENLYKTVAFYSDFLKSLAAYEYYTFIAQQQFYFCEEIKLNINTGDITVLFF